MSDVTFRVYDDSALRKLELLGKARVAATALTLRRVGEHIVSQTQKHKLRGQVLKRQSGTLANSLQYRFIGPSRIHVGTGVKYGAIHEYGYPRTETGRRIYPKTAKALHFYIGGVEVFAKSVKQVLFMPKRPWLAPQIEEEFSTGRIASIVDRTLQEFIDKVE